MLSQDLQFSEKDSHSTINHTQGYLILVLFCLNFNFNSSKNGQALSSIKAYGSGGGGKLTNWVSSECFLERERKKPGPKG